MGEGAVIVVGTDGAAIAARAAELAAAGRRVATFTGDPDDPDVLRAVEAFAAEQFGSAAEIVKDSNLAGGVR